MSTAATMKTDSNGEPVAYTAGLGKPMTLGDIRIVQTKKKTPTASNGGNGKSDKQLPDLSEFEVLEMTDEEKTAKQQEASTRRQWAEGAAKSLAVIRDEKKKLEDIRRAGPLTDEEVQRLKEIEAKEQKLENTGDEELQRHRKFASFLELIRKAAPLVKNGLEFMRIAIAEGRYRQVSPEEANKYRVNKQWPHGTIFFGKTEVFTPSFEEVEKSEGQKALEAEFINFAKRLKQASNMEREARIKKMEEIGNPNLDLISNHETQVGVFLLRLYAGVNPKTQRKYSDGWGLIQIADETIGKNEKAYTIRTIKVIEGEGSLAFFNNHKGETVPLSWYFRPDSIQEKSLPDEVKAFAEKLVGRMNTAVTVFKGKKNRQAEKPEPELPADDERVEMDTAVEKATADEKPKTKKLKKKIAASKTAKK